MQVLKYLELDKREYLVLPTGPNSSPGPLDLCDHWSEIPQLSDIEAHFEICAESNPHIDYSSRKRLQLTLADLVQPCLH